MKKTIITISVVAIMAVAAVCAHCTVKANENPFLNANVEALASGEVSVSSCLGLWGECTLPDGTKSLAPAIHVGL